LPTKSICLVKIIRIFLVSPTLFVNPTIKLYSLALISHTLNLGICIVLSPVDVRLL